MHTQIQEVLWLLLSYGETSTGKCIYWSEHLFWLISFYTVMTVYIWAISCPIQALKCCTCSWFSLTQSPWFCSCYSYGCGMESSNSLQLFTRFEYNSNFVWPENGSVARSHRLRATGPFEGQTKLLLSEKPVYNCFLLRKRIRATKTLHFF